MRSIADVSRFKLAEQLGLTIPPNIDDEKRIWRAVSDYSAWGPSAKKKDEWIETIRKARAGEP